MFRSAFISLALVAGLAGCTTQEFRTAYTPVNPAFAASWTVSDVTVSVPDSLSVSDVNSAMPAADIVWQGEPVGDRREQVAAIIAEGIESGAAGLSGRTPVTVAATVSRFHAVTPEAERVIQRVNNAGVDNIAYTVQVFDASGAALTEPQEIQASLPATTASNRAEIVAHIAGVTAGWLGVGPDQNSSFQRIGR